MTKQTKELAGEMVTALNQEMDAVKADELTFRVAQAVEVQKNHQRVLHLTFDRDRSPSGQGLPNRPLECGQLTLADGARYSVELLARTPQGVQVLPPEHLAPSTLRGATLRIDTGWLLERQREVIRQVVAELDATGGASFRYDLALAALNAPGLSAVPVFPVSIDSSQCAERLNEEQLRCAEWSSEMAVSLIWGPPGTGKTRTLVDIAVAHARAGQRVLVVAPSNTTADQLVTGCARLFKEVGGAPVADPVLRWGKRWTDDLPAEERGRVLLDRAAAERAQRWLDQSRRSSPPSDVPQGFMDLLFPTTADKAHTAWVADHLFKKASIVVCPVAHLYLYRNRFQGDFDTVLIDEASMLTLPTIWLASGYARRRVVIAGDPSQLGAPLHTYHRSLGKNVFALHGASPQSAAEENGLWTMLTEQHRMVEPICAFVSDTFYGGRLVTAGAIKSSLKPIEWPWDPDAGSMLVIDTSEIERTVAAPRAVYEHATYACAISSQLIQSMHPARPRSILQLSGYRNQVDLMRKCLKEREVHAVGDCLRLSTIHGAQGGEADAVVLTLDDCPDYPGFLRDRRGRRHDGLQLLNVAISRAKRGVVVIGPVTKLAESPLVASGVRSALEKLLKTAAVSDANTFEYAIHGSVLELAMQ